MYFFLIFKPLNFPKVRLRQSQTSAGLLPGGTRKLMNLMAHGRMPMEDQVNASVRRPRLLQDGRDLWHR